MLLEGVWLGWLGLGMLRVWWLGLGICCNEVLFVGVNFWVKLRDLGFWV